MDAPHAPKKTHIEKCGWEVHMNATSVFEQITDASQHEKPAAQQLYI